MLSVVSHDLSLTFAIRSAKKAVVEQMEKRLRAYREEDQAKRTRSRER